MGQVQYDTKSPTGWPVLHPRFPLTFLGASTTLDDAVGLIIKIVQSLMDPEPSDHHQSLKLGLELLSQTLNLARLAIETYGYTQLGWNFINTLNNKVDHCYVVLQELHRIINCYTQGLTSTVIQCLWHQILWGGFDIEELPSLWMKLAIHQKSPDMCLIVLNSYVLLLSGASRWNVMVHDKSKCFVGDTRGYEFRVVHRAVLYFGP